MKWFEKIDSFQVGLGNGLSWLNLYMAGMTFIIVVMRYALNINYIWLQDTVMYTHAFIFLSSVGYTFARNAHVRVDIFFQTLSPCHRAWVNLWGTLLFLLPTLTLLTYQSYPYIRDSWRVWEGSSDGGGLSGVFILKSFIFFFCFLGFLQALSILGRSFHELSHHSKKKRVQS